MFWLEQQVSNSGVVQITWILVKMDPRAEILIPDLKAGPGHPILMATVQVLHRQHLEKSRSRSPFSSRLQILE